MAENRDFKGVWIPKEIWLNTELTWMEKLFLTEIWSLDNKDGCFASNAYLAKFFQLQITRTSQIINSLIKKNMLNAKYERKGKQIVKRVLTVKCNNLSGLLYEPIRDSVTPHTVKCKDNNTSNNTKSKRFTKPTKQQLSLFCKEINYDLDIDYWLDNYNGNGWLVGKDKKMKDWKATVRNWQRRNFDQGKAKKKSLKRGVDYEIIEDEDLTPDEIRERVKNAQ